LLIDASGRSEYEDSFLLNGEVKTFLIIDQCLKNEKEENYAILSSALDITARIHSEHLLKESEEKFRYLIETMQIGMLIQGPKAEILLSNSKALELLGLTESQLLGMTSHDPEWNVIHEDGSPFPGNTRPVSRSIESRKPVRDVVMGVYRPLHDDRIWLLVNAEPQLNDEGNIKQVVSLFLDISERKHAESIIQNQNQELRKLNAEKDKFFSIIGHDLKSPISSFIGLTDIIVNKQESLTLERIQRLTRSMRDSATNLYRLLENLLEWSKLAQGLITFNPENVFLLPILKSNLSLIKGLADSKGIKLTIDIAKDLEVYVDCNMLKSVFRNLLSNAIKFTPRGGKITLSAIDTGNESIKVCIKDTGIGMNKDIIANLFRIDEQTGRPGTEGEPSTGLGLFICKDFIETNNGRIWVKSIEGVGSEFYFTLPSVKRSI